MRNKDLPNYLQILQCSSFFFSCDCGSKVFFEALGYPWPIHDCLSTTIPVDTRPSTVPSIPGVSFYRGLRDNDGLMRGLVHAPRNLDPSASNRLRESQKHSRETVRMDPLGSSPVDLIGVVQDRGKPNLARRLGIQEGTIGYALLRQKVGSGDLVQLTILVDDLGQDPAAIDLQSYTIICKSSSVSKRVVAGSIVNAKLAQAEVLGGKTFWYSEDIDLII